MSYDPNHVPHQRIDEIEVLRALAILITFVHHVFLYLIAWYESLRSQVYAHFTFWGGVDLFFVISGFVIARDFFRRQKTAPAGISFWRVSAAFWVRRAFRILPSAWLWLGLFLLGTLYWNQAGAFGRFEDSLADTVAGVFQFANYHQLLCAQQLEKCGVNGIYWSLSLEEQFYLLFPLVVFVSRRALPYILIAGLLAQFFLTRPEWTAGWAFRTDGFIWGVLLALWSERPSYRRLAPRFLARFFPLRWLWAGLLIGLMLYIPNALNGIPWSTSWLAVLCALVVWTASYGQGSWMQEGWPRRFFTWLGSRSYAIYLTHMFAIRLALEIYWRNMPREELPTSDMVPELVALAAALTLIFSEMNYRLLEQPVRKVGVRLSKLILEKS